MRKSRPSVFSKLSRNDRENLSGAIRGKKYWKISEDSTKFVYVIALSRARIRSPLGFLVETSAFRRVQVVPEAAKFSRKYRVLLLDLTTRVAFSAITWTAFTMIMKKYSKDMGVLAQNGKFPPYVNRRILKTIMSNGSKEDKLPNP